MLSFNHEDYDDWDALWLPRPMIITKLVQSNSFFTYYLNICLINVLLLPPPQYSSTADPSHTVLCLVSGDVRDGRLVVRWVFSEDLRAQWDFSDWRLHVPLYLDILRGVNQDIQIRPAPELMLNIVSCKCPPKVPQCSGPLDPIHWSATSGGVQVAA